MGCEMITPPRGTCLLPVFRRFHISQRQRARANFQGGAEAGFMGLMGCEMMTPSRGTCLLPVFRCFHISQRQRARANFQGGAEAGLMGCER